MIVVGAGLAGLATAIQAAVWGHTVTVVEKGEQVGGAAAYSGGQVWVADNHLQRAAGIPDDLAAAERYVRSGTAERPEFLDEDAMRAWLEMAPVVAEHFEQLGAITWSIIPGYPDYGYPERPGSVENGRYLTAVFDAARLGEWREKLLLSPHFPIGSTYEEVLGGHVATAFGSTAAGGDGVNHLLTFGPGVVGGFLARAVAEPAVTILTSHSVTELLDVDGEIVGAVITPVVGEPFELRGRVVLAAGGIDWDPTLVKEYLDLGADQVGSGAPTTITGDALRLARSVGGAITVVPAAYAPMPPGYPVATEPGFAFWHQHSLPHTFIVDAGGRRFCDDSLYFDVVRHALDHDDPRMPCYAIWDEQHRQRYGSFGDAPDGSYPTDVVSSAGSLAELAVLLGIDGDELARTAASFNADAEHGVDAAYGRGSTVWARTFASDPSHLPNPNIGPVDAAPFYGMPIRFMMVSVQMTGITIDASGRVLNDAADVVPGLYAVGSCAAFGTSGVGLNSGYALSRAMTLGYLAAADIASASD
ncbi:MAG TPA: FAD-dependent oxidoreductase [Pseudonocardia sp.]